MCNLVKFTALYIIFIINSGPSVTHSDCKQISALDVDCSRVAIHKLLLNIPNDLDSKSVSIDMYGQYLETLPADVFTKINLPNLREIGLDDCNIESIDKDAFKYLHNLRVLSLKNNKLSLLDDQLFQSNREIQKIFLSNNKIVHINDKLFHNLTNLTGIDLSYNRITEISKNAFETNLALEFLYLAHNFLFRMGTNVIKHAKALWIDKNPWICDCNLRELRDLVVYKYMNSSHPLPHCKSPGIFKEVSWDHINSTEFVCGLNITNVFHVPNDIYVDDNITLKCAVRGYPLPRIQFIFQDENINIRNHLKYIAHNPLEYHQGAYWYNLTIFNIKPEDQGLYKCVADSQYGTDHMGITLNVQYSSPFVMIYPLDSVIRVEENTVNVTISCQAKGIPKPNIHWKHKGNIISVSTKNIVKNKQLHVVEDEENSWLNITFARIQQTQDGEYKCVGSNSINTSEKHIVVRVKPVQSPEIIIISQNEEMNESTNVTLACGVIAVPKATVNWRRIHKNKTINMTDKKYIIDSFVTRHGFQWYNLTIINLLVEDSDEYQCFAFNSVGEQYRNVILNVSSTAETWALIASISFGCITFCSMIIVIILKCCIKYHCNELANPSQLDA